MGIAISRRFQVMNFLHGVHAAIGLGEQTLDVEAVLGAKGRSYTHSH
jgi:hypothetical protein